MRWSSKRQQSSRPKGCSPWIASPKFEFELGAAAGATLGGRPVHIAVLGAHKERPYDSSDVCGRPLRSVTRHQAAQRQVLGALGLGLMRQVDEQLQVLLAHVLRRVIDT